MAIDARRKIPEYQHKMIEALCKLFIAESEMLSVEKGKYDTGKSLPFKSRAKICKDVSI